MDQTVSIERATAESFFPLQSLAPSISRQSIIRQAFKPTRGSKKILFSERQAPEAFKDQKRLEFKIGSKKTFEFIRR